MLLMIDNYDSFTYTLVNYLESLSIDVVVKLNDEIDLAGIAALAPDQIMISPGPGTPDQAGISLAAIRHFGAQIPIFGVCLGCQALGQVFGAKVVRAKQVMHGKTSAIHHRQQGVFAGLRSPFNATRYHSLALAQSSIPDCLEVTAWTEDAQGGLDEIMAIRHTHFQLEAVQFHPESILTEQGLALLRNFVSQ
ncbi:aminodeoxychorismate/anthranilate synthase component II [Reinekea sp.]|jgi:anthranilate synthase component 2|uniref:anthranilate synthase component II n=1 Tax=Reinekea sp. TaxID=1970455 RepID=UPI002A82B367|nr:aminodeoxychorismate/anthranilate synthase component II [Reinekea sp.]